MADFTRVARAMVLEGIEQRKRQLATGAAAIPIGAGTEQALREELGRHFPATKIVAYRFSPSRSLACRLEDFGLHQRYRFAASPWGQCDLYSTVRDEPIVAGEVKTTTSALQNVGRLANVVITGLVGEGPAPRSLAIVLWPDMLAPTLRQKFERMLERGLAARGRSELIDDARESLFILTGTRWAGDAKRRLDRIPERDMRTLPAIEIMDHWGTELFCSGDVAQSECLRLLEWCSARGFE